MKHCPFSRLHSMPFANSTENCCKLVCRLVYIHSIATATYLMPSKHINSDATYVSVCYNYFNCRCDYNQFSHDVIDFFVVRSRVKPKFFESFDWIHWLQQDDSAKLRKHARNWIVCSIPPLFLIFFLFIHEDCRFQNDRNIQMSHIATFLELELAEEILQTRKKLSSAKQIFFTQLRNFERS